MSTETMEAPAAEVLDAPKLSAVKVYNPIEAGIALMLKKHGDVLVTPPDVSTPTAMKATKANLTEMVKFRTSIEAARKAEKEESLVYGRLVDSEAKRITAIAAPIEKAYSDAITAEETRLENLRIAALEAERKRIEGHRARIQSIKDVRETANLCRTSDRLKQLIGGMPAHMEKTFEEFQDEALTAFNEVCTVLGQLHEAKVVQEQQAAELARQQQELAAQLAEQARRDQEAADIRAAEQAETDRKAAIRAKLDAMRELRLQAGLAKTSADVSAIQDKLMEPDDSFAEFLVEAQELWTAIAGDLADLYDNKLEAETRAADLAAAEAETKRQQDAIDAQRKAQEATSAKPLLARVVAAVVNDQPAPSPATVEPLPTAVVQPVATEVLSIAAEPERPTDKAIVNAVAAAFNVDYITALDWLEAVDFHELNS